MSGPVAVAVKTSLDVAPAKVDAFCADTPASRRGRTLSRASKRSMLETSRGVGHVAGVGFMFLAEALYIWRVHHDVNR